MNEEINDWCENAIKRLDDSFVASQEPKSEEYWNDEALRNIVPGSYRNPDGWPGDLFYVKDNVRRMQLWQRPDIYTHLCACEFAYSETKQIIPRPQVAGFKSRYELACEKVGVQPNLYVPWF